MAESWVYEIVSSGDRDPNGFALYEARFWSSAARKRDGLGLHRILSTDGDLRCDLMNNFKMQVRENHQRLVRLPGDAQSPEGYLRHVSGLVIPNRVIVDGESLATFLTGKGLPLGGYTPFMFPNSAGIEEPLDGMWQRELHTVPPLGQAEANIERYLTLAEQRQWGGDRRGTTLNLQVGASADDAFEEVGASPTIADTFISFGESASDATRVAGARFTSVAIIKNDIISAATATFVGQFGETTTVTIGIGAEDVDDAATFTTTNANVDGRVPTTAITSWTFSDTWTDGVNQTTDDFAATIQEIVDRAGWATGQDIAMLFDGEPAAINTRRSPHSYDSDTAKAPKLDITFSGPVVAGSPSTARIFAVTR